MGTPALPSPANDLNNLVALKSNLIQALRDEAAYQAVYGAKPSYTLPGGKQVQWNEYRTAVLEQIKSLNDLIQIEGGPFEIRTQAMT
jgi:hypothetical protein